MGFFQKKVSEDEWKAGVGQAIASITKLCDVFEATGEAVGTDPITGWVAVAEPLSSLRAYEEQFRAAEQASSRAGTPISSDPTIAAAKQSLDAFFSFGHLAFHWGKFHYADASGGPGERARTESGFAQKAALRRVANNGNKFAENALNAVKAGRAAAELVQLERYRGTGPSLMEVFAAALPEATAQLRRKTVKRSQAAMIGSWLFSRAAILGMVASPAPDQFISMVWDPTKIDAFWKRVNQQLETIDKEDMGTDTSLGYQRMRAAYPELYGVDAFTDISRAGMKKLKETADSPVAVADARMHWSMDAAVGLGVGIVRPDFVRACLQAEADPDPESWRAAYEAGVDLPPEPETLSVEEQVEGVLETCRPFFSEYYPQAKAKLDELTTPASPIAIGLLCPACRTPTFRGGKFCGKCGHKLA